LNKRYRRVLPELWASEASAYSLVSGGDDPDIILPLRALIRLGIVGYPAIRVDHVLKDGDTIRVGPLAVTAHITGGHTRGRPLDVHMNRVGELTSIPPTRHFHGQAQRLS
jgi:hypothetical protein